MTDQTKAPERIWVETRTCTVDASGASRLLAMDREFSRGIEYTRKDLSDAKDKRVAELEAKLEKAVTLLEWQTRLIDNNVTPSDGDAHRINIDETWYTGPVVDWTHSVLTNWKKINIMYLAELKGGG